MASLNPIVITSVHVQPDKHWKVPAHSIIADDSNGKVKLANTWNYQDQRDVLGDYYEEFAELFHKSSASKNFGLFMAYIMGRDAVMIDSDCMIPDNFVEDHVTQLTLKRDGWVNPLYPTSWYNRGFPYEERKTREPVMNMGLWSGAGDVNGRDRIENVMVQLPEQDDLEDGVALGNIPISGMNVAIRHEAIPAYLLLPNADYKDVKFRRHDDIWGGYIFQQLARLKGDVISYGEPFVYHSSVVDPVEDALEEQDMIDYHKEFEEWVRQGMKNVDPGEYKDMFKQLTEGLPDEPMFATFKRAMELWSRMLQ